MREKTPQPSGRGKQFRTVRDAVWHCKQIGGSAKLIALRLVEHLPDAFPSLLTLADWTGLSERTVRVALRELESKRVVETRRTGRSNVYAFAFVGVSIPELGLPGGEAPPNDEEEPPESGGREAQHRQNLPVLPGDHTPAESADQTGSICRSDRRNLPPKQGSEAVKASRRGSASARGRKAAPPPPPPALFTSWNGWKLSPELRAELIDAGIPADRVDHRVLRFKNRPVRKAGVPSLDDYIREQVPRWLEWERGGAPDSSAGTAVSSSLTGGGAAEGRSQSSSAPRARRAAPWIHVDHVKFARAAALDLPAEVERFKASHHLGSVVDGMPACNVYAPFLEHLQRAKAERAAA
jgi:DNA-binding transcriptional ArsR family regulator